MNKLKKVKMEKGITLVALIITIVVLLILSVVTINSIQGNGIIRYAQNAADEYTAKANEEQENLNTLFDQIGGSLSGATKITWTKTSTGDLAIGSTVKTSTNEEFYVIGGDTVGTQITNNTKTVILLAKNNLKADGSVQDTGATNPCVFSSTNYWSSETNYPADLNDTEKYPIPEGETSIVTIARTYGASLGATGRLMLKSEAEDLNNDEYSDILYGRNGKSSGEYLNYWLGSADTAYYVWRVYGGRSSVLAGLGYNNGLNFGVRPVVEILKSNIS